MNETEYWNHYKKEKEAEILCKAVKDLYGDEADKKTIFLRARIDGTITEEEYKLLKNYAPQDL